MHRLRSLLLLFIIFLFNSCQYFTLLSQQEWRKESGNDEVDIYISGYRNYSAGSSTACYWKIGENDPIDLEGGNPGGAFQIKVYGNDIYICGEYGGVPGTSNEKACYWKNGKLKKLECPYSNSSAQAIDIVNGSIYLCGFYRDSGTIFACYWIDGVFHSLNSTNQSAAWNLSIQDSESDSDVVLIAGQYDDGTDLHACYWKDGVFSSLSLPSAGSSQAFGIVYKGDDLFVCGNHYNPGQKACYWKNNIITYLDSGTCSFMGMKIINNDIYYMEEYNGGCRYFKNDNLINLPYPLGGVNPGASRGVCLFNDTLYICGYARDTVPRQHVCWWKDSKAMGFLEDNSGANTSFAIDIAVKYK